MYFSGPVLHHVFRDKSFFIFSALAPPDAGDIINEATGVTDWLH